MGFVAFLILGLVAGAIAKQLLPGAEMTPPIKRTERRTRPQMVPQPVQGQPGLVQVDATWGTIQPMRVAEGVHTVGEVEVISHLEQGLPVDYGDADECSYAALHGRR